MEVLYETEGQFSSVTGATSFPAATTVLGDKGQLMRSLKHVAGRDALMVKAAELVYEATTEWFDSQGEGTWPRLAPVTVARKVQSSAPQPSTPLVHYGNLRASVISSSGPHSFVLPIEDGIVLGVNWESRGYQVADVLARGTTKRVFDPNKRNRGAGGRFTSSGGFVEQTGIPARSIWPPPHSASGMWVMHRIGQLFLKGI